MSTHTRFSRRSPSAALFGAVLVLAACGGGSSSDRQRNSSMATGVCYATQAEKDDAIKIGAAEVAGAEAADAVWATLSSELASAKDDYVGVRDRYLNELATRDEVLVAEDRYREARDKFLDANEKRNWLSSYRANLRIIEERPLCADQTEITSVVVTDSAAPTTDSSTVTTDGGAGAAGTGDTVDPTETTIGNPDGTDTTLDSVPTTGTDGTDTPTTTPETFDPIPPAPKFLCDAPVLQQGMTTQADAGENFDIDHAPCVDPRMRSAVSGPANETIEYAGTEGRHTWTISIKDPGIYKIGFTFTDPDLAIAVSETSWIIVTVTDPNDSCAGKKPTFANDNGKITMTRTCDRATELTTEGIGRSGNFGFFGWGAGAAAGAEFNFGDFLENDCFDVVARQQKRDAQKNLVQLGDAVITTVGPCEASPSTDGSTGSTPATEAPATTVVPTTIAEENSVVTALPVRILQPEADGQKPLVVSFAKTTEEITCDAACLEAQAASVGLSRDQVSKMDISIDGSDWSAVKGSFSIPMVDGGSVVRLRFTPESGPPQILSAKLVAGKIDEIAEGIARPLTGDTPVFSAPTNNTSGSGSSFPWWIIVLAVVLVAVEEIIRRLTGRSTPKA